MTNTTDAGERDGATGSIGRHTRFVLDAYLAIFDRVASDEEIVGWSERLAAGETHQTFFAGLLASEERRLVVKQRQDMQVRKGAEGSDERFVTQLYRLLFDREPDADGLQTHVDLLVEGLSHSELLDQLEASPEAVSRRARPAAALVPMADLEEVVQTLFDAILHRDPENSAVVHFVEQLQGGIDLVDFIRSLANSPEAQGLRGQKHSAALNASCANLAFHLESMLRRRGMVLDQGEIASSDLPIAKSKQILARLARTIEMVALQSV